MKELFENIKLLMNLATILAPWLFLCYLFPTGAAVITLVYFGIMSFILFPSVGYFVLIVCIGIPLIRGFLVVLVGG